MVGVSKLESAKLAQVNNLELKNYLPLLTFVQRYLQSSDIDFPLPLIDHLLQSVPSIFPNDFSQKIYDGGKRITGPQTAFFTLTNALPWCENRKVTPMHMALVIEALSDYEANKRAKTTRKPV